MNLTRGLYQLRDALAFNFRTTRRELGVLLAFVVIFPLGFLFFLGILVQPSLRLQILVGSIMMEMALLNINAIAQGIGADKDRKMYDLWVSMPMSPTVYVVANALTSLPISLLSAGVTLAVGFLLFGLSASAFTIALLFLAFVLIWASTLGVGFLIGVYGRGPRQINTWAQFVGIVATFFAPVFYPVTILPLPLRWIAYGWPVTWGAVLLRSILHAQLGSAAFSTAVLAAFTAVWVVLIAVGLRWRQV
jgi:ABC-2 type transport system permease protein